MSNETYATPRFNRSLFKSGFAGDELHHAIAERDAEAQRRLEAPAAHTEPGWVRLIHGANEDVLPIGGRTVCVIRREFGGLFNIAPGATAFLDGDPIEEVHLLRHGETLEFIKLIGRKGMGRVWTKEEFCEVFKIGGADLDAMIDKGLPVHQMGDGSIRITETQVDEFLDQQAGERGPSPTGLSLALAPEVLAVVAEAILIAADPPTQRAQSATSHTRASPYWDVEQAAVYLNKTPKAIYGLIGRGRLRKMPGSRVCYFTRDMLDEFLRGETANGRGLRPGRRKKD